jgi:hypothetical protein
MKNEIIREKSQNVKNSMQYEEGSGPACWSQRLVCSGPDSCLNSSCNTNMITLTDKNQGKYVSLINWQKKNGKNIKES